METSNTQLPAKSVYMTRSINEAGYLMSIGLEPLGRLAGETRPPSLIFPFEARTKIDAFNAGRDRALQMLGGIAR
jgi:hypothetical protein